MTTILTRTDYLDSAKPEVDFEAYHGQFVTDATRHAVESRFGKQALRDAYRRDKHLNTIPLGSWDALCSNFAQRTGGKQKQPFQVRLPYDHEVFTQANGSPHVSQADLVCIAKCAARQIIADK